MSLSTQYKIRKLQKKLFQMNIFLASLFCKLYDSSFRSWMNFYNEKYSFTSVNSITKVLNYSQSEDVPIIDILEHMFFIHYFRSLIDWYEEHNFKYIRSTEPKLQKKKLSLFFKLLDNPFYGNNMKENVILRFCTLQKSYFALNRFAYLWKLKHAVTSVTTDLYFNDIDKSKDSTFQLYQNNTIFVFKISELIRIIETSLYGTFEDMFEVESEPPKNPYNKMELKEHDLYNIYLHIAFKTNMNMPTIMYLWFKENFNFYNLCNNNRQDLQKLCIKNYVSNFDIHSVKVYKQVRDIINNHYLTRLWKIDLQFPNEQVVEKIKPCLYDYYMTQRVDEESEEFHYHAENVDTLLETIYRKDRFFGTMKKTVGFKKSNFTFVPGKTTNTPFIFRAGSSNIRYQRKTKLEKKKTHQPNRNNEVFANGEEDYQEFVRFRSMNITVNDTLRDGFQNNVPIDLTYEPTNDVVYQSEISTEEGRSSFIDRIIQNYRQHFSPISTILDAEREEGEVFDNDVMQKEHEYDLDNDLFKYF